MNKQLSNHKISNPYSTGGGGVTFEQLVGTTYLVSLLEANIPRGLDWGITNTVGFQQRWSGCLLDDITITSSYESEERKLALQVKRDVTFSDSSSNTKFANIIDDCWKTFKGEFGWEFDESKDRLGIGLGVPHRKVYKHFCPLLEWARTSLSAVRFFEKISLARFSSQQKKKYIETIKNLTSKAKGEEVTDEELWRFLKCLVVVHFDIESDGGGDWINCRNRLLGLIKNGDPGKSELLLNNLTSIVAKYARSGGTLNFNELKGQISSSVELKDKPNFQTSLNKLRKHSEKVLNSIKSTIGGSIFVRRDNLLDNFRGDRVRPSLKSVKGLG